MTRPSILVISWHYPTPAAPQRGLWVQRMAHAAAARARVTVIVPTPWVPPGLPIDSLARFRRVPHSAQEAGVEVHFPRVPGSIEYLTHVHDARLAGGRVAALARRLHKEQPFDLIHAHFIFPDGVVAARLGRELGIPVMTSEHAYWSTWFAQQPREAAQVDAALPFIRLIAPVSQFLREDVERELHGRAKTLVLPNVVDDQVFHQAPVERDPDELLFVGLIRRFKRLDVLLRALVIARKSRPALRLKVLSADALRAYASDRREISSLIDELGLRSVVQVITGNDPPAVADAMRRCALVVVSSTRRETFCAVAAEALACGTPLVCTRCGGPEEFVGPDDGVMVAPDDPQALCQGILEALERRGEFDSNAINARVVARFGRKPWAEQALAVYQQLRQGTT